jgi:hypothetical protein
VSLHQGNTALAAMGLFTAMLSLSGCHASGAASQHLDISPRYAAVMYGLTNGLSSMLEAGGIAVTGVLLDRTQSWAVMFCTVAGLHVLGGSLFLLFGDSTARFCTGKGC